MRILLSCIPYDSGKSGISVYVREVARELAAQGHALTLLCEPGVDVAADIGITAETVHAPAWTRRAVASMLWHLLALPFWIAARKKNFDAMAICAANRRVLAWYPLPTVATVHDLANFHIPGKYSRLRMIYLAHILPFFAMRAQHLIAVSAATKTDMVRFWRCAQDRVSVLYNGLAPGAAQIPGAGAGSSILYISRIEHPGKNHVRLIEAYGKLDSALAAAHPLVIAGADWKDAETVHAAAAASPNAAHIRFTGFVDDIAPLWRDAGFYVFPSLFEGFGLSLAEAMAMGIPCACSENGALGEVGADAAIKFDPLDAESIASALRTLLTEPQSDRAARIARGRKRAADFSWAAHARGLAELAANKPDC